MRLRGERRSFRASPNLRAETAEAAVQKAAGANERLMADLAFLGASHNEAGELTIEMPKYHAAHGCDEHRKTPWRTQDLDQCIPCLQTDLEALRQRAEVLARALRSWDKSQEEPAGELCWCSEGEALSAMSPADHARACIRARDALRPAKETT